MGLFTSYSRIDAAAVAQLVADLQRAHLPIWHDHELHGGGPWWQEILEQIRECDVFILALSNNVVTSKPCMAEVAYARALGLPILPVQIGPVDNVRTTPVADIQVIDYRSRTVETLLTLVGAINEAAAQRGPLPDPLPEPPAVPFEYLARLGSAISAAELTPHQQGDFIRQLRECVETEDDEGARDDARELLRALRRRNDVTYRNAEEIDRLFTELGVPDGPAGSRERRGRHQVATRTGRAPDTGATRAPPEGDPVDLPRRRVRWVVLSAVVVAVLVVVGVLYVAGRSPSRPSPSASNSAGTQTPTPTPTQTPSPTIVPVTGVFSATSPDTTIGMSIVVADGKATAYVCNGRSLEVWLRGTVNGDQVQMSGPGNATLAGAVDSRGLSGRITTPNLQLPFLATAANPPAGVYKAEVEINGVDVYFGWTLDQKGVQFGVLNDDGSLRPAPRLDPQSATFVLNGKTYKAERVQAGEPAEASSTPTG